MENPSGLSAGDSWVFASPCNFQGVSYSQVAIYPGPWALAFQSRRLSGTTTCGQAIGTVIGLTPGRIYKVFAYWTGQGNSTIRDLAVSVDGGVGTIGAISGVTADLSTWLPSEFSFVARQATHQVTLYQPPGTSSTRMIRYLDSIAVADLAQDFQAVTASLSPKATARSLSPTATARAIGPGARPGY